MDMETTTTTVDPDFQCIRTWSELSLDGRRLGCDRQNLAGLNLDTNWGGQPKASNSSGAWMELAR